MSKKAWDLVPTLKKVYDGEVPIKQHLGPGLSYDLTEGQRTKVTELYDKYKLKVIAVIEGGYRLGGETVHMVAYVYAAPKEQPWVIEGDNVGFMADVINETWDIEEMGSVGVVEINGSILRTI